MKIGVCGPILTASFRDYLDPCAGCPPGLGGMPVVHVVRALLERGRDVVVFTLDRSVSNEVVLQGPRLKVCIGPYRPRHRARDIFRVERNYLAKAICREQPDVVHAFWTYEFALGALKTGIPSVVTAEDAPFRTVLFDSSPYRLMRALMAVKVTRQARCMTAVSTETAGHFARVLRYRSPIRVIPNGLPREVFAARREPLVPNREPNTCATVLNGWGRLKNGRAALQAFALVRKSNPRARLLMMGDDYGEKQRAAMWASAQRVADGVRFVGPTAYSRLLELLSSEADIFVHPSVEDAFSLAIAEAMALGIPVIAGAGSGGVRSTLDRGAAGLLIDVRSPEELAAAIRSLMSQPEYRRRLGSAGRESALRRFRIETVVDKYEEVYLEAMNRCASSTPWAN